MASLRSFPGALRLASVSIIARLPQAMLSIALLVHVRHLTGSFATAGIVAGAFAVSLGVGGPLLGRLVDRRGQTMVLLVSALVAGAALAGTAAPSSWGWARRRSMPACAPSSPRSSATAKPCVRPMPPSRPPSS